MLGWIWYFITGYVKIQIKGLSMEQLLNHTTRSGIRLRSVYRGSYTSLTACITRRAFSSMQAIARDRGCALTVLSEHGIPYLWQRFLRRQAFAAGLALVAIALAVLSQFVFEVELEQGLPSAVENQVMEELDRYGLHPLTFKPLLNIQDIREKVLDDMPELSFLSIRMKGVRATVKAVLKVQPPLIIDRDTPCDIVAAKDAMVKTITVMYGEPAVKVGDVVRPGQVLVRGMASGVPVHAIAQVTGQVWYRATARADLYEVQEKPTGNVRVTRTLWIGAKSYPWLAADGPPFTVYRLKDTVHKLPGIGIALVTHTWTEMERDVQPKDMDALQTMLEQKALAVAMAGLPEGVQSEGYHTEPRIEGNTLYVDVFVRTVESIGLEIPLKN